MSYEVFSSSNQDIDLKVTFLRFDNSYLYSFQGQNFLFLWLDVSNSCILFICSVNILVVWITLPHSGHGFLKYFKTKLVYHKYHIPKFSFKWTNSMFFEVFSSSNQDIDTKVTFLRFENNYLYSFQGLNFPIFIDAVSSIHVFFSYVQLTF